MRIHIDHREQAPALEAELHRQGIRLYRIRLSLGDYRIDNRLLFERKTLTDLRLSLRDGRLFDQARRLYHWAAHHPGRRVALILEGRVRPPLTPAWERRLIQGALLKLSLFWGIPVFRALCQEESARLMPAQCASSITSTSAAAVDSCPIASQPNTIIARPVTHLRITRSSLTKKIRKPSSIHLKRRFNHAENGSGPHRVAAIVRVAVGRAKVVLLPPAAPARRGTHC
jgi:hypothetical protein